MQKTWKITETVANGYLVLIWEYSARAFIWVLTWLGSDDFHYYLLFCALDEHNLSSKRVKRWHLSIENRQGFTDWVVLSAYYLLILNGEFLVQIFTGKASICKFSMENFYVISQRRISEWILHEISLCQFSMENFLCEFFCRFSNWKILCRFSLENLCANSPWRLFHLNCQWRISVCIFNGEFSVQIHYGELGFGYVSSRP